MWLSGSGKSGTVLPCLAQLPSTEQTAALALSLLHCKLLGGLACLVCSGLFFGKLGSFLNLCVALFLQLRSEKCLVLLRENATRVLWCHPAGMPRHLTVNPELDIFKCEVAVALCPRRNTNDNRVTASPRSCIHVLQDHPQMAPTILPSTILKKGLLLCLHCVALRAIHLVVLQFSVGTPVRGGVKYQHHGAADGA